MQDFKASRDLEPGDFKKFAAQCTNDIERGERRLREAEYELKRAQDSVSHWRKSVAENKLYCAKHGVPLSAV